MTAHSQHIISFCSERNNPACEITRNAIIIELDIKSKTKLFASTAYLLSSASPMSAPCLFVATYWTLVKDSELKKKIKNNQMQRLPKRKEFFICTAAASKPNLRHQEDFILLAWTHSFEISPAVATKSTCSEQQSRQLLFSLSLGERWWNHMSAAVQISNPETQRQHVNFVASFL